MIEDGAPFRPKRGWRWSAASGRWRRYTEGGHMEAVLTVRKHAVCERVRTKDDWKPGVSSLNVYRFDVIDRAASLGNGLLGYGGSPAAAWKAARTNLLAEALTT